MAMPTKWPMTVATDEPVMPQPQNRMKTMSRQRLTTLSMTMASETSLGLPSTPIIMLMHQKIMYAGAPSNTMRR